MTDDDGVAIAYDVLRPGTPVVDSDGAQVGTVREVLDNKREHIFDGIVVSTPDGRRFVDAPEVGRITDQRVTLTIDRAAVSALPAPAASTGSPVTGTDSFVGRWRKRLGL
jgi:sporulation protein YlmC with PRC-barrel domain